MDSSAIFKPSPQKEDAKTLLGGPGIAFSRLLSVMIVIEITVTLLVAPVVTNPGPPGRLQEDDTKTILLTMILVGFYHKIVYRNHQKPTFREMISVVAGRFQEEDQPEAPWRYTDTAVAGEAAAYAIGLVMVRGPRGGA